MYEVDICFTWVYRGTPFSVKTTGALTKTCWLEFAENPWGNGLNGGNGTFCFLVDVSDVLLNIFLALSVFLYF